MALIGSINEQGELQGQINGARYLTGVITNASAVGGQVVGMRGLKGDTGDTGATGADGQDGFSPSASVSKVGDTATITITDKDGTTTAEVYDGSGGGASAFIAEYGVTTYADVKDAYDEDAIIICTVDDSGNTVVLQLAYFDDANDTFIFAQPVSEGSYWTSIAIDDTWDDGYFMFASTDTATQLRDGLMSALDKQKLDGIASGAEVNVQSDWSEADSTADDYIKNKPTIPSQPSDIGAQEALVSGTNIKTINNTSLLGSGDISTHGEDIFIAEVANTSFPDLKAAYDDGKLIYTSREYSDRVVYSPCYCDVVNPNNQMVLGCMSVDGYVRWYISYFPDSEMTQWIRDTKAIQEKLVSGTNIKTINNTSLLGSGDISTGGTSVPTADEVAEFDSSAHMNSTDMTTGADSELEDFIDGLNVTGFDIVEDISDKFTFTSSWSRLVRSAYKIGKLVVFSLEGNAGAVTAGTQYTMVTIASGYRPRTTTYYTGHGTNSAYLPQGSVNSIVWTSGDITVRPQTNTCNYIFLSGMYVLP